MQHHEEGPVDPSRATRTSAGGIHAPSGNGNGNGNGDAGDEPRFLRIDEQVQKRQCDNLARVKAERDATAVRSALAAVREEARGKDNLMPPIIDAARAYCSEQEICDVLRETMGTYSDPAEF